MCTQPAPSARPSQQEASTKRNIFGVLVDAVDYGTTIDRIMAAAKLRLPLSVSATAVHGLMLGAADAVQRHRLNRLDLVVPDGQPVRWALNLLHGSRLRDRVRGPTLTDMLCEAAARHGVPIYFYGSSAATLARLQENLERRYPGILIAGVQPSRFRTLTDAERADAIGQIRDADPGIVFVGLGCPRQEVWAYENRDLVGVPVLAVGAAFDYLAGQLSTPPDFVQRLGLEWLYRLIQEPTRLWRRYLFFNSLYVYYLTMQMLRFRKFDPSVTAEPAINQNPG